MRTRIVVPCYNEAARLRVQAFEEFAKSHREVGFLFVNDGSSDDTGATLRRLSDAHEQLSVLDLDVNSGKAEAVRRGVLAVLELEPAYVGFWDADLATPLEAIDDLEAVLDARPDLEMVFGSRVKLLGRSIERSALRHYAGRVFATATSRVLELPIYDTQCGAKLFRVSSDIAALFDEPFLTRWTFDVEIIARLIELRRGGDRPKAKDVIYEYPLHCWHDVAGSKVSPWDFPRALWELARIRRRYLQ